VFFPSQIEAIGHVRLGSNDPSVSLVGDVSRLQKNEPCDIHGKLPDGRHLSLLECITIGARVFHGEQKRTVETSFYPHLAVLGSKAISSTDAKIKKISYQCGRAHRFCLAPATFGTLHPSPEAFDLLIDSDHERVREELADSDWEPKRRAKDLGQQPIVAFFDGNHEIAQVKIPTGQLSIWNCVTCRSASAKGVQIDNTVFHTIEFDQPQDLGTALSELKHLHQFYELNLGGWQKYKKIQLILEGMDELNSLPLRLHWNMCNRKDDTRRQDVHPGDIPVWASTERQQFQIVIANWMAASKEMASARFRLFSGVWSNGYTYDRLIGAANMYDLLPETKVPNEGRLNSELSDAVRKARAAFKPLARSPARDSVLSALGRIGKPSLRAKILHRAEVVNRAMELRFENLDVVCHHAVLCRNHLVHGSEPSFNYAENPTCYIFLIDTLEFIFAAADLIECGWDPQDYLMRRPSVSHFFGRFLQEYEPNMARLNKVTGMPY